MSTTPDEGLRSALTEVHAYVATPFTDDLLGVRADDLAAHVDDLVRRGVRVLAVGGGTGESDALSPAEQIRLVEVAMEAVGDRALVVGTLPGNVAEATDLASAYEARGLRVALSLAPLVRGRPVADPVALARYYNAVADRTGLPLMPYNNQAWPVEVLLRLGDVDGLVAVKDACIDPLPMMRAIQQLGDRFVWIGNKRHDPGVAHLRYRMGMEAFTSGLANAFPEPELRLHEACRRGDEAAAIDLQRICAPFERLRSAADDAAAVKAAMDAVGYRGGPVRPPRLDLDASAREEIRSTLEAMGAKDVVASP